MSDSTPRTKKSSPKSKKEPKKPPRLDLARFKANPDAYFPGRDLADAGVRSEPALERDRWLGVGIPYTKVGRNVLYLGQDVIDHVLKGRTETKAA